MTLARQTGDRQHELLAEAYRAKPGVIMVDPKDNARYCAVKRAVRRGFLIRHQLGSDAIGWTMVYEITPAGEQAYRRGPGAFSERK